MKSIPMKQLCSACVTRRRGQEAATKLRGQMPLQPVEIDLSDVQMVSASFLDELVCQLMPYVGSGNIVFRVTDADMERKLQQVAGIRSAPLFCRSGSGDIHQVIPKSPPTYKLTYVIAKTPEHDESGPPS